MKIQKHIIKKYPNRRLYDTKASAYITLNEAKQLLLDGADIQVIDAKTANDITRSVLLQILLEAEADGSPMFSDELLVQFIRFYGQAMQGMVGAFLEQNLQNFLLLQQQVSEQTKSICNNDVLLNNKLWSDFLSLQNPLLQNTFSSYLDQSSQLYVDLQQRMQEQAKQMLNGFVFADTKNK